MLLHAHARTLPRFSRAFSSALICAFTRFSSCRWIKQQNVSDNNIEPCSTCRYDWKSAITHVAWKKSECACGQSAHRLLLHCLVLLNDFQWLHNVTLRRHRLVIQNLAACVVCAFQRVPSLTQRTDDDRKVSKLLLVSSCWRHLKRCCNIITLFQWLIDPDSKASASPFRTMYPLRFARWRIL